MLRIFLLNSHIYVYDKTEKEFKDRYGPGYEQISIISNPDSLDQVLDKLRKTYKPKDVVFDFHRKKKFGWKYFDENMRAKIKDAMSKAHTGRKRDADHIAAISASRKGRGCFKGKTHSEDTKKVMSLKAKGHKRLVGLKWCHDPKTGKERRVTELPPEFRWGRNPELELEKLFSSKGY